MMVAAGEMNSLVAKHLAEMGVAKMIICNRSRERADQLVQKLHIKLKLRLLIFQIWLRIYIVPMLFQVVRVVCIRLLLMQMSKLH